MDSLVTTEWLERELGAADLRVIDATLFLPGEPRDARAEYEAGAYSRRRLPRPGGGVGHVQPGAAHGAARAQIRKPDGLARASRRPALRRLRQQPAAQRRPRLVDAEELRRALCRHPRRRPSEMEGGGAAAGERPAAGPPRPFQPELRLRRGGRQGRRRRPDRRRRPRDRRRARRRPLHRRGSRSPGREWRPATSRARRTCPRAGCSTPTTAGSGATSFAPPSSRRGVDLGKPMVATCGSGVTACVLLFGAHLLGKEDVRLYDGSWSEWGADPATPKATGPA